MDWIIAEDTVAAADAPAPPATGTPAYASPGDLTAIPPRLPTVFPAYHYNSVVAEVMYVITQAGILPNRNDNTLLYQALGRIVGGPFLLIAGGTITGSLTVDNTLIVSGNSNLQAITATTVAASGTITAGGAVTANAGMDVWNDALTTHAAFVAGAGATVHNGLIVGDGGASVAGGLTVSSGGITVTGNSGVTGGLSVAGTINTSQQMQTNGGLNSAGTVCVGNVTQDGDPAASGNQGVTLAALPPGSNSPQLSVFSNFPVHIGNSGGGNALITFYFGGVSNGSITSNGASGVAFNATSDYRLKADIKAASGALDVVTAVTVHDYVYAAEATARGASAPRHWGFLAHELQAYQPRAVTGEKDAVRTRADCVLAPDGACIADGVSEEQFQDRMKKASPCYPAGSTWAASHTAIDPQMIDPSKLVPTLWLAVQELSARLTTALDRVAVLEAKSSVAAKGA